MRRPERTKAYSPGPPQGAQRRSASPGSRPPLSLALKGRDLDPRRHEVPPFQGGGRGGQPTRGSLRVAGAPRRQPRAIRFGPFGASALTFLLLLCACDGTSDETGDLKPGASVKKPETVGVEAVEHPDLAGTDPAVRQRLETERRRFEELLAAEPEPERLALGYGVIAVSYR